MELAQKICFYWKIHNFYCNHYETWLKWATHKYHILTSFLNDCMKIVDFSIKAYFWVSSIFYWSLSISSNSFNRFNKVPNNTVLKWYHWNNLNLWQNVPMIIWNFPKMKMALEPFCLGSRLFWRYHLNNK